MTYLVQQRVQNDFARGGAVVASGNVELMYLNPVFGMRFPDEVSHLFSSLDAVAEDFVNVVTGTSAVLAQRLAPEPLHVPKLRSEHVQDQCSDGGIAVAGDRHSQQIF